MKLMLLLEKIWRQLNAVSRAQVMVGAEIEFYVRGCNSAECATVADRLRAVCAEAASVDVAIKPEIGDFQYEITFQPTSNPFRLIEGIAHVRRLAAAISEDSGSLIDFRARPDFRQPPNALQVSVSLIDESGHNLFSKRRGCEFETPLMTHSLAGLCDLMNASMIFFAPTSDSFRRFAKRFTHGRYMQSNAPSTVSWGGNNRTVALRIPSSSDDPSNRRLEHRVPSSDADPMLVVACIFAGMLHGISKCLRLEVEKEWGDASCSHMALPLAANLRDAIVAFESRKELSDMGFRIGGNF